MGWGVKVSPSTVKRTLQHDSSVSLRKLNFIKFELTSRLVLAASHSALFRLVSAAVFPTL